MWRRTGLWICCGAMALVMCVGCSEPQGGVRVEAPPAPSMPGHWTVVIDMSFPADEVKKVGNNLGGKLASLRNPVYEVNGKSVQLNTIVAIDEANADKIMIRVRDMKPDEAILRRGVIIYEFVCASDAILEMREGNAHLQGLQEAVPH